MKYAGTVITAAEVKNAVEEFVVSQIETELPANASVVVDVRWQNDIELDAMLILSYVSENHLRES